jgi:excisionase family DNA binding protein
LQLSVTQTAQLLGKTRRQVEYLIKQGRLPARKVGGRWQVEESDLELSPGQRQAARRRADALRDTALGVLEGNSPRPRYSMTDLHAFQTVSGLWRDGEQTLGPDHHTLPRLRHALDQLALGCHRFEREDKARAYHEARDALALAACALHLETDPAPRTLAVRIEGEAIPAVSGLLRRSQGKGRR